MHGSVTVGTKGQIVIPKDVRDMLNIEEGDILMVNSWDLSKLRIWPNLLIS